MDPALAGVAIRRQRRARHLLAFAAAIFPEEGLTPFAADLSGIVAELGIPPGEEIKRNPPKGAS